MAGNDVATQRRSYAVRSQMRATSLGMSSLVPADTESFDRAVLAAGRSIAVLFSAAWCGPCRALAPLLERVASAIGVALAKVDIDSSPELALRYGIRSVPTLLVLSAGDVVARQTGSVSETALRRFLGAPTATPRS
jgi:thioredoxin 1